MIVLDASATVELLLGLDAAEAVARRIAPADESLHAPHVIDLEVAQVVRRWSASGDVAASRAGDALVDLADLDVHRYGHDTLLPRIWDLRHNLTAYDAAYVALAEALDAPLITTDARLADAPGHDARIELLSS